MEKKKENYTMHDLCKAVGFRTVERAMNKEFITAVDEEMLKLIKKKKENIMVTSIRFCTNIDLVRTRRK